MSNRHREFLYELAKNQILDSSEIDILKEDFELTNRIVKTVKLLVCNGQKKRQQIRAYCIREIYSWKVGQQQKSSPLVVTEMYNQYSSGDFEVSTAEESIDLTQDGPMLFCHSSNLSHVKDQYPSFILPPLAYAHEGHPLYAEDDPLDHVILGKYLVIRKLASGGEAHVYEVKKLTTGMILIAKISHLAKQEAFKRMERAANIMVQAKQGMIIHDIAPGIIIMDRLCGVTLEEFLRENKNLGVRFKIKLLKKLAIALNELHKQNIIHRDLKPSNIFIFDNNDNISVSIIDYGLAKNISQTEHTRLTKTGSCPGTVSYMPVEIINQKIKAGYNEKAWDFWALGVIAYEIIKNKLPFKGSNDYQIMQEIVERKVYFNTNLPINDIIQKCLEKNPVKRYQSSTEIIEDINLCLAKKPLRYARKNFFAKFLSWK